jgi:hypothetical protein
MQPARQLELGLAFHDVRQIAVTQRRSNRAAHAEPAESEGERERRLAVLGHRKIVIVGDVTQVGSFNVDANLKLVGLKGEVVGILDPHDQVQGAAGQPESTHDGVIEPDIRLLEVVAQAGASDSGKGSDGPHYSNIDLRLQTWSGIWDDDGAALMQGQCPVSQG